MHDVNELQSAGQGDKGTSLMDSGAHRVRLIATLRLDGLGFFVQRIVTLLLGGGLLGGQVDRPFNPKLRHEDDQAV